MKIKSRGIRSSSVLYHLLPCCLLSILEDLIIPMSILFFVNDILFYQPAWLLTLVHQAPWRLWFSENICSLSWSHAKCLLWNLCICTHTQRDTHIHTHMQAHAHNKHHLLTMNLYPCRPESRVVCFQIQQGTAWWDWFDGFLLTNTCHIIVWTV